MKILAVVPARGGSRGIQLKNIQKLNNKSLIAHVANVINETDIIDCAVVSTDHELIKKEALNNDLQVPFMRPEELSGDLIGDLEVLSHAVTEMEKSTGSNFDIILMLQPTSPLRNKSHIIDSVKKLVDENLDSVWTVSKVDLKLHALKQLNFDNNRLSFYENEGAKIIARQQLDQTYFRNGACYAFTRSCIMDKKTLISEKTSAIVIDEFMLSIDSMEDLEICDLFIQDKLVYLK